MRKILLFVFAATMLVSCDNFKGSSSEDEEDTEEVSTKKKKKKKKSTDESEEGEEEETTNKRRSSDDDDQEEETESSWTSAQRKTFLNQCESEAVKNVTNERAKVYCSCMLEKIEGKFKSFNEANSKMTDTQLNSMAAECNQ